MVSGRRTTEYRCHQGVNCVEKRLSNSESYPAVFPQVAETAESLDTENRIWIMTNRRCDAIGAPVFSIHSYSFDDANRRDLAQRVDATLGNYGYNDRSGDTSGKYLLNGGALLGWTASNYTYDATENRLTATSGGSPAAGFKHG